jgi:hypothetical protein
VGPVNIFLPFIPLIPRPEALPRDRSEMKDSASARGMGSLPMFAVPRDFDRYSGRIGPSEAFFEI